MPTAPNRRIRYTLTAIGALGLIGAGSTAIVVGSTSGDREIRLAATTPEVVDVATADPAASSSSASSAEEDAEPSSSPSASTAPKPSSSASASASVAPSPSASASASITSQARPRPSASRKVSKSPTPAPAKTTEAPSTGDDSVAGEVLRLVNVERQAAGCDGLSSESRLQAAAQKHSELQAEQNSMSHQLPGEAAMGDRVTAEGYRWRGVGENVAAGYTSAASVMDGWMNSPGHKANILNCGFEEIGVGIAKSSSGTQYWTQVFATPA
ncbi:CAP domain-containing protein [Actinoplanes sp. NPDC023714]|uniref:CAP domain-containing protein n=1 Tax=Actinoplanes sp. NPDC023714 TaxID=3154322 RepID=UPI00340AE1C1